MANFRSQLEKAIKRSVKQLYDLDLDPALFSKKTEVSAAKLVFSKKTEARRKPRLVFSKKTEVSAAKLVEHPKNEDFGDYATGIALTIASKLKTDPLKIARQLSQKLSAISYQLSAIRKIAVASPGFINFWLSEEALVKEVNGVNEVREKYGRSEIGKGRVLLIDYSSPNIAKPFGIGHLRSTIIGQALFNLYSFAGWKVVGENYLGDWGTQFGKLIVAVLRWGDEKKLSGEEPIEELEKLYVKFHQEAAKDPALEGEAREWFKKLEEGDKEAVRLWKKFREWSLVEFERVYKLLGVKIDKTVGESDFVSLVPQVIKEAKARNLAVESEGALVISFAEPRGSKRGRHADLPPLILLKSDGATTYEARDLAAITVRKKKYRPDLYLYETGVEQALRFKQLFLAAEMLGHGKAEQFVHVAHGLYRFPEGKISTRAGRTLHLEEVLGEAVRRARKIVGEKNPPSSLDKLGTTEGQAPLSGKEREEIARAVGVGAVKYNDLSQHYSTEVVFDWEKMLSLEGNSAPYLQYTYARARSVLRKSGKKRLSTINYKLFPPKADQPLAETINEELPLLRYLYRFPEVLQEATIANSPNLVCNFLFELAQRFNTFYEQVPIIRAESLELRDLRLNLTAAVAQVVKNGLNLLGVEVPERL